MTESATAAPERITPQMGFGSMTGILTSESDKFLQAFLSSVKTVNPASPSDEFLLRFVTNADSFTVACCEKFASFLREASIHSEVRGTSAAVLARLVRNRCFEAMDLVLADYLDLVKRSNIDITPAVNQLAESRVRDSVSHQIQSMEGAEEPRKLLAPQSARASALLKIFDYLGAFNSLGHEFLDYGSSKLFGGDVDFALQERFLRTIAESLYEKLNGAVAIVGSFELVKQRKWELQRAAESATIMGVAMMASQSHVKRKSGVSSLVIGVVCGAPIWLLFNLGFINRYVIGLAVAFGLAAIFFFFRGILHLTKG